MTCKIVHIGNAGILLSTEKTAVMIDGLYVPGLQEGLASPIPLDMFLDLFSPNGKQKKPDCLIFTHCHKDHYSQDLVSYYLMHHQPACMVLPKDEDRYIKKSLETAKRYGIRTEVIDQSSKTIQTDKNICITCHKTGHSGKQYVDVPHYCMEVQLETYRFLFTGDYDFFHDDLLFTQNKAYQGVFINPLAYHNPNGQKMLGNISKLDHVFIYHIPYGPEDDLKLARMVHRDMQRTKGLVDTIAFDQPGMSISI